MLRKVGCFVFLLTCVTALPARAANPEDRVTLTGLRGVGVVVESVRSDAESDGLARSTLQTDVELKLRQAGIRVIGMVDWLATDQPYLYANVNTFRITPNPLYAFSISVELKQKVLLQRNSSVNLWAATWRSTGAIGTVGASNLSQVRGYVKDQVDQFINAYLAVNPK